MSNLVNPESPEAYAERIRREQAAESERHIAKVEAERDLLRAAIATPEVYKGLITALLENQWHDALREVNELKAKLATAKAEALRGAAEAFTTRPVCQFIDSPDKAADYLRRMADEKEIS